MCSKSVTLALNVRHTQNVERSIVIVEFSIPSVCDIQCSILFVLYFAFPMFSLIPKYATCPSCAIHPISREMRRRPASSRMVVLLLLGRYAKEACKNGLRCPKRQATPDIALYSDHMTHADFARRDIAQDEGRTCAASVGKERPHTI